MRPFDIRSDHTSQSAGGTATPPPSRRRSLTTALRLRLGLASHRSVVRGMLHWRIAGSIAPRTRPNTGDWRAGISEDAAYILFPAAGVPLRLGKLEVLTRSRVSDKADRTEYRKRAPLLAACLLFSCSIVSSPISTLRQPTRRRVIARLTWLLTRIISPQRIYRSPFGRDPLSAHSTPIVVDHPHSLDIFSWFGGVSFHLFCHDELAVDYRTNPVLLRRVPQAQAALHPPTWGLYTLHYSRTELHFQ